MTGSQARVPAISGAAKKDDMAQDPLPTWHPLLFLGTLIPSAIPLTSLTAFGVRQSSPSPNVESGCAPVATRLDHNVTLRHSSPQVNAHEYRAECIRFFYLLYCRGPRPTEETYSSTTRRIDLFSPHPSLLGLKIPGDKDRGVLHGSSPS
jgi:hypothetical protein